MLSTTTPDHCKIILYDDLLSLLSSTCVIRVVLSVSYLLASYFVKNFLRRIISVCHSFRSMCRSGRMKGFESCFKVEDQGTWRRQNLYAAILRREWMFGNRRQKARASTTTLSSTKLKNWTNVSRASLPKFAKTMAPPDYEPDSLRVMLCNCPRETPQTKWQQNIHSEGPRIRQVQTGLRG